MATNVAANTAIPTIPNTFRPAAATASNGPAASPVTTGLGTTFLSLLVKELQNQDPTAPVDSTAMVGQIISLNQLDQLIAIKQTLGGRSSTTTPAGANVPAHASMTASRPMSERPEPFAREGGHPALSGASSPLPFDPVTMMPLAPNLAEASAAYLNSSLNSPLNAATLGFTGSK